MKAYQGPGRKGRLRRKHRRDIHLHKSAAYFPQSAAGAGKQNFEEIAAPPATAKEMYAPHDCKQADFPSGPLKSLPILNIPALWLSTNLEMTLFLLYLRPNSRALPASPFQPKDRRHIWLLPFA